MHRLPDEVVLHIFTFLNYLDLVNVQLTSRRFLKVGRDNEIWKQICFERTRAGLHQQRMRLQDSQNHQTLQIVHAMEAIAAQETGNQASIEPSSERTTYQVTAQRRTNMMASWDPSYPNEDSNFYQEFIHRHAPVQLSWLQGVYRGKNDNMVQHEATGMGILYDDSECMADKLIAPMDDGSICIWDVSFVQDARSEPNQGRIIEKTSVGLLAGLDLRSDRNTRITQSKTAMTETGAVEVVSIDNKQKKGYFGVTNMLNEVDLHTMQVVSRSPYPFAITALSEARHPVPLTIGTNGTVHLHDPRQPIAFTNESENTRLELIGGTPPKKSSFLPLMYGGGPSGAYVSLSQPGALSILHIPEGQPWDGNGDIWVAGRFTSLLNYDRRLFPKIHGTVHSGARLSSLALLPFPYVPHDFRNLLRPPNLSGIREAKARSGNTILAAGEYKGKGSLELYGLSSEPKRGILVSDARTTSNPDTSYRNRYSASRSKLLSAVSHGCRIVFSDGDGWLKWVERDGSTPVRQFNINDAIRTHRAARDLDSLVNDHRSAQVQEPAMDAAEGDIVQKIIPMVASEATGNDVPLGQDNLLVWTGDGMLGMVGFGTQATFLADELDEQAQDALEHEQMKREREYDREMRRALERQAAELRWVRGYGLEV
ncbi:hypothetical protein EJ05DRAFT_537924 [Pseudovirgaria hyperparasitica]|uniref:F-box domain-containing protein n=1 Tax=Pseudovirgaria hyperparasitica TaxID=470096 RepID=A0A6A6WAG8_9PEZI|nr:uncharacterized protein EJ05DRAFT_537924 [Pseudovirgaria hyperparasitica]KAF2758587.1 hypothetical protein EJ05DRAFT_537924 [Pseudovirgaria hyperparasitica]